MTRPTSPLECVLDAWVQVLADFRAWVQPETPQALAWKQRAYSGAIFGCKSKLVDDVEGMIGEWRKYADAHPQAGESAFLPVLLTAVAASTQPPDVGQIRGIPYFVDAVIGEGEQSQLIGLRTVPKAIRTQIVYLTTNPHDASSISDQFCAYVTDDARRKFLVTYQFGQNITEQWDMTILENSLFPDVVPSDAKNLTIITVDVTMMGLVPQIVGLDADKDNITDNGYNRKTGAVGGGTREFLLVEEADQVDSLTGKTTRVSTNPETGDTTEQELP